MKTIDQLYVGCTYPVAKKVRARIMKCSISYDVAQTFDLPEGIQLWFAVGIEKIAYKDGDRAVYPARLLLNDLEMPKLFDDSEEGKEMEIEMNTEIGTFMEIIRRRATRDSKPSWSWQAINRLVLLYRTAQPKHPIDHPRYLILGDVEEKISDDFSVFPPKFDETFLGKQLPMEFVREEEDGQDSYVRLPRTN